MISAKVSVLSPQVTEEYNRIRTTHNFKPALHNVLGEIAFTVKNVDAQTAINQIQGLLAFFPLPFEISDVLSFIADGNRVVIGVHPPNMSLK